MSIQFRCEACGREYDLPEMTAGKKAKCECGVLLTVPTESMVADKIEPSGTPAVPPPPPPAAPPTTPPSVPPPLPPAYQPVTPVEKPPAPIEKRYRNLRAYCGWLRLLSWLVLVTTALALLGNLAVVIPRLDQLASNPLPVAATLIPALVSAATGAGLFVLINAVSELFHVLMDIEENTRRR
ncbi:MAG: hypothetical protein AAF266_06405 [Planctomycetota bacterium]